MLYRIIELYQAILGTLMAKMNHPVAQLEKTYQTLQATLNRVRQAVAQATATETQLEQRLQKCQARGNGTAELEAKLKLQREKTAAIKSRLRELEDEVQRAYTKKQVLIATDKAANASSDVHLPSKGILFIYLVLLALALIGASQGLRH
jgi:phage shock protein A